MSALPQRARRSFVADPRSVAHARRFARALLEEWGAPELRDNAALVVSELVTNAVVHTGTTAVVDLRLDAQTLRVEVEDQHPSRALPTGVASPDGDAESGRGLLITSALASSMVPVRREGVVNRQLLELFGHRVQVLGTSGLHGLEILQGCPIKGPGLGIRPVRLK